MLKINVSQVGLDVHLKELMDYVAELMQQLHPLRCRSTQDYSTCNQASDRCAQNSTTKLCEAYTCESYDTLIGSCKLLYTWDIKKFNICSKVEEKCVSTDAATLVEEDCQKLTGYQYSWNLSSPKLVQWGTTNSIIANNTNVQNITEYGYVTFVVIAFLTFEESIMKNIYIQKNYQHILNKILLQSPSNGEKINLIFYGQKDYITLSNLPTENLELKINVLDA